MKPEKVNVHKKYKYRSLSWVCPDCKAEGYVGELRRTPYNAVCPYCGTDKRLQATGRALQNLETGLVTVDDTFDCECKEELVLGVLFPWFSDAGVAGIERCDLCKLFQSDSEAAKALGSALRLVFENEFSVDDYTFDGIRLGYAVYWEKTDDVLGYDAGLMLGERMKEELMARGLKR